MHGTEGYQDIIFTLDNGVIFVPSKRGLISDSDKIFELSENSYRFLLLLLQGETDKQNIIKKVWHEQRGSVSESSYYGQLYLLRQAFTFVGLSNTLIKTIPRRGVKYIGYVTSGKIAETELLERITSNDKNVVAENLGPINSPLPTAETPVDTEILHSESISNETSIDNWYQTRSWNIFVTTLAVLAVCWLTTIIFFMVVFLKK